MDLYTRKELVTKEILKMIKELKIGESIEIATLYNTILINGFNKKLLNDILENQRKLNEISIKNDLISKL
jgi:hypothetical protein